MSEQAASISRPPPVPSGRAVDVAVALLVGVLFGISPLTSGGRRLVPSLLGGVVAGVGFFLLRRIARRPAPPREEAPSARRDRVGVALLAALAALTAAPAFVELYPWYTESVWRNGHSLFVPLLAFGLARVALREDADATAEGSAWGFAPLVPGLALVVLDAGIHTLHLSVLGLTLVATGASLLLYGVRKTRRLALPIGLLLFLVPLPESLARYTGLVTATAAGTQQLLYAFGMPAIRSATSVILPDTTYEISYRCSGFAALYGGIAAALALGWLTGSRMRAAALLLSVWPLTWLANVLRCAALIVFCEWRHISPEVTQVHGMSGIAAFLFVLAALVLLAGPRAVRRLLA
jgi:exosortase